jgi:signal-transduction protein with cAMP-binding, CBS, and nucleotidyltransferase domain
MPKTYAPLSVSHLPADCCYIHSGEMPELVHLDDLALNVMFDYEHTRAITVDQHELLADARIEMKACGVHVLLVIDESQHVVGIISSEDILGEKPVKVSQEKDIPRAQVKVRMVMTPREHVVTLNYADLRLARVGELVQTLRQAKQHYALVTENKDEKTLVRGLFSLTFISKHSPGQVGSDDLMARTVSELRHRFNQ